MKNECKIIRDILPLYVEKIASQESVDFVEEHLKNCPDCQKECDRIKEPSAVCENQELLPLKNIRHKMRIKKMQTIALTAFFVIALLVSAFSALDAPEYASYSPKTVSVKQSGNEKITVSFGDEITDYSCRLISNSSDDRLYYEIEAWKSIWDTWFSERGEQSTEINTHGKPVTITYVQNNGVDKNVIIYGEENSDGETPVTLPRLALAYYLIFAVVALILLAALRVLFRKRTSIKAVLNRLLLYPISYIISHLLVMGFSTNSYSMPRDFYFIVFVSILLYCGMLLASDLAGQVARKQ